MPLRDNNKQKCSSENIRGYPTFKLHNSTGTPIPYEGDRTIGGFKQFLDTTDIYLFDSKGYENSMSFDHTLIENLNLNKKIMVAGNIQINDNLENLKKIADIIDISGGLETSGLKDISKIETFLNKIKNLNYES